MTSLTITQSTGQYNILNSVSYTYDSDATVSDLVDQIITPALVSLGFHVSAIRRAYIDAADDISDLEDSIKGPIKGLS